MESTSGVFSFPDLQQNSTSDETRVAVDFIRCLKVGSKRQTEMGRCDFFCLLDGSHRADSVDRG